MQGWLTVFLRAEEKQGAVKTPSQAQPLLGTEKISIKPHEMCKTNTILAVTTAGVLTLPYLLDGQDSGKIGLMH